MSLIAIIIIFICIGIDNMVSANMSALNMSAEDKSVFSIKMALFFTGFNVLAFMISYLLSAITHNWIVQASNWVAFALLLLLGIKFMLESIEKSPSFNKLDLENTRKLIKVSAIIAMNSFFVGYAAETMDMELFPAVVVLALLTFLMTLLGFHLGKSTSKTVVSKRGELVAGLVLVIMAVCLIMP